MAFKTTADMADKSQVVEIKSEADSGNITEYYDDVKPEPCLSTVPDKRFTKKRCLNKRRKRHFGQKLYSCAQCKKCFFFSSNLYHHMNIHTGKYECSDCGKRCGNNRDLTLHMKYKCTECGECCGNKRDLTVHRQNHAGEKLFECTVCSKQFTTSRDLFTHSKMCHGKKLHQCSVCDMRFSLLGILNIHMKMHQGEELYSCSQSSKSLIETSDLEKREDCVQSNRRRYHCSYCMKQFKTSGELKQHERVHTGAKPYSCRHCSDCFTWPKQLQRHLLLAHNEGI